MSVLCCINLHVDNRLWMVIWLWNVTCHNQISEFLTKFVKVGRVLTSCQFALHHLNCFCTFSPKCWVVCFKTLTRHVSSCRRPLRPSTRWWMLGQNHLCLVKVWELKNCWCTYCLPGAALLPSRCCIQAGVDTWFWCSPWWELYVY